MLLQASDEHLGLAPIILKGPRPSPFETPKPVVLIHNVAAEPDEIQAAPFGIGVSMGRHLAVFPLADDAGGSVYDIVDRWMSTGILTENIAAMPWSDVFGEGQTFSRLQTAQSWTWTAGPGPSPVKLVRADPARARIVLSSPVRTRPLPVALPPIEHVRFSLPQDVKSSNWVEAVAVSLEQLGLVNHVPKATVTKTLEAAHGSGTAEDAIRTLESSLPPAAGSHASDMYRIFLLNSEPDKFDALPDALARDVIAATVRRITGQRIIAGSTHEEVDGSRATKSAEVAWPRGSVALGPAYTWHTLRLMTEDKITDAVATARLHRHSTRPPGD